MYPNTKSHQILNGIIQPDDSTKDYHYLNDAGGNVVKVLNADDLTVANDYEYGPFGQTIAKNETVTNPYQYNTKYHDEETGLLYYGFRYLDTDNGRWVNRDPIGYKGGINVYNSVSNNMVNGFSGGLSIVGGMSPYEGLLAQKLGIDPYGLNQLILQLGLSCNKGEANIVTANLLYVDEGFNKNYDENVHIKGKLEFRDDGVYFKDPTGLVLTLEEIIDVASKGPTVKTIQGLITKLGKQGIVKGLAKKIADHTKVIDDLNDAKVSKYQTARLRSVKAELIDALEDDLFFGLLTGPAAIGKAANLIKGGDQITRQSLAIILGKQLNVNGKCACKDLNELLKILKKRDFENVKKVGKAVTGDYFLYNDTK